MPQVKRVGTADAPITVTVGAQPPSAAAEVAPEKEPLQENWFFDLLADISSDEWARVYTLELRRLEPKLAAAPGTKGFLDVFTEPVTKAMIKKQYGGGKFRLLLLKNNKYKTSHDFDIEGDPIYARGREVAPDNSNGTALEGRLLNMMETNMRELKEELKRREASGTPDPAFEKAVNILSTAYTTGLSAVQKEQSNPTALLKDLVSTAKEMGLLGANGNGGDGGIIATIRVLKELGLIGQSAVPQNPLEQLNLYLSIFEKMDDLRGGGGGRRGKDADWKETLANKFGDALPTILERMGQPRARAGVRPGVAAPPQRPSVQPNPQPITPRAAAPGARPAPAATGLRVVSEEEAAPAASAEQPAASAQESAVPASAEQIAPEALAAIEEQAYYVGVKRRVLQAVKDGDEGSLIADFLELAWPQMVNYLESFNAEQISKFLAQDPILGEAVQHPNWPLVLRQAQEYLAEDAPAEMAPN